MTEHNHTMDELLAFMGILRETFPQKNPDEIRCTVGDICKTFNTSSDEVWGYVIELEKCYLIDNNGGKLRFNDNTYEDLMEMHILYAIEQAIHPFKATITVGFLDRVFSGIYREHCFCSGKFSEMETNTHRYGLNQPMDVMKEIMDITTKKKGGNRYVGSNME